MIQKKLSEIAKPDIEALVAAKIEERRTLDYKEVLPGNTDEQKKEFLYDLSSFANAAGGDLIFGVTDQRDAAGKPTGIPDAALGLAGISNTSAEVARLENMIQTSINPRIAGVELKWIDGFPSGPVLIVRVPKSWASPHMVTFKGASKFYSRNTTGKYPLDVHELRAAFASTEILPEKIRRFRQQRIAHITARETPIPVKGTEHVVIHIVPLGALTSETIIDLSGAEKYFSLLKPIGAQSWDYRFNIDGFLTFSTDLANYIQIFRSGAVEILDSSHLVISAETARQYRAPGAFVAVPDLEVETLKAITASHRVLQTLGVAPPVILMITLLGVLGMRIETRSRLGFSHTKIDRDVLMLPEVMLEDYTVDVDRTLKPAFDTLWQSAGLPRSSNYDEAGNSKRDKNVF